MGWRDDVRAAVAAGGKDFTAHVTSLAPARGAWKHADEPALAGLEVGQAACAAVLGEGDDPEGDSYYAWPAPLCVGRGLVLAIGGLRMPRKSVGPLVKAAAKALT